MDAPLKTPASIEGLARSKGMRRTLDAFFWIAVLACVYWIGSDSLYQWDFEVYYTAAHALAAGHDPYAAHSHANLRGSVVFQYPPLTLTLFHWTCWLTLSHAKALWLSTKLASLGTLVYLWHRHFERLDFRAPMLLFMAVGFGSTILKDLTSGNIGIIEQLLLWASFSLLIAKRPYLAATLIACVAQFKLLPGFLLGLILLIQPRTGWKPFVFGSVLLLTLLGLNYVVSPDLTREYLALFADSNVRMDDRNINNPSSLAMFRDIVESTSIFPGFDYNRIGGNCAYGCFLFALLLFFGQRLWRVRDRMTRIDPRLLVYIGVTLYTVTMPRMKDYSYALMLMPALFVITDLTRRRLALNFLLLSIPLMLLAQPQQTNVPGMDVLVTLAQAYFPLLLSIGVLFYLVSMLRVPAELDPRSVPRPAMDTA